MPKIGFVPSLNFALGKPWASFHLKMVSINEAKSDKDIHYFTTEGTKNWRYILEFGNAIDINERRRFSWAWPTEENLIELKRLLNLFNVDRILSIGCGSGLLEWILSESIGVDIFGLESDKTWWSSKYAVTNFIRTSYIEGINLNQENSLQVCCSTDNWNFCLLFCYFNNRIAFLDYLQKYQGQWLIIIGPCFEVGFHTDPDPMNPKFPNDKVYLLRAKQEFGAHDILTIYEIYYK